MQAIGSRVSRNALKYSWLAALVPIGVVSALLLSQSPAGAQTTVPLGTAGSFAVLGGSTVTNTGPTILNGDLGVWPGTSITGFPPGIVNGTIHDDDGVAIGGQSDSTTAYNFAAGESSDGELERRCRSGTDPEARRVQRVIGAAVKRNVVPGRTGQSGLGVHLPVGSTLTTGSSSHVVLIGGAQA